LLGGLEPVQNFYTRLDIITLYQLRCNAAGRHEQAYNKGDGPKSALAATRRTMVAGTAARLLATALRARTGTRASEAERGLQRVWLTRTAARALGLLIATALTTLTALTTTLATVALALRARRWRLA